MKHKLIKFIFIFLIILFIFYIYKFFYHQMSGLTVRQAYIKAYTCVSKVNENIMLYTLTSVDIENKKDSFNGEQGKRDNWNLDFSIPETDKHYIVQIQDGDIRDTTEVTGLKIKKENLISNQEILLDSDKSLEIAKKIYHILPGNEWAIGFHYTIKKEDGISKQTIVAYDKNRNLCKVDFDMQNKTIISAKHKINVGGGIYDSNGIQILENINWVYKIAQEQESDILATAAYEITNDIEYEPVLLFKTDINDWKKYKTIEDILDIRIDGNEILIICKNKIEILDVKTEEVTSLLNQNIISARQSKNSEVILTDDSFYIYNSGRLKKILQIDKNIITENSFAIIDDDDNVYFCNGSAIYTVKNNELEVLITSNEPLVDVLIKSKKAYIVTQNEVSIYDIALMVIDYKKKNSENIVRFVDSINNDVLALNGVDNYLLKFKKIGDAWEVKKENTLDKEYGILMDINEKKENSLIYAFTSNATWMDMPSERTNK